MRIFGGGVGEFYARRRWGGGILLCVRIYVDAKLMEGGGWIGRRDECGSKG